MKKILAMAVAVITLSGCAVIQTEHGPLISKNNSDFNGYVMRVGKPDEIKAHLKWYKHECGKPPAPFDQVVRVGKGGIFENLFAVAFVNNMHLRVGDKVHIKGGSLCNDYPRITKVIKRGDGSWHLL
ncbi:MAG: hypothetical protein KGI54_14725 [Pseudomonadota bacterium]|nr:hypothetical protein [Pseudomonadota bacterium]